MPKVQMNGRVEVVVEADIADVWAVVSDVTRTGEWSHECTTLQWLGPERGVPGARFRGTNHAGPWRWSRISQIVTLDPPREICWVTVPTTFFPDSTRWSFRLTPTPGGTSIVQSFEVVRAPFLLDRLYALLVPSHRDRDARLAEDLERIGHLAKGKP